MHDEKSIYLSIAVYIVVGKVDVFGSEIDGVLHKPGGIFVRRLDQISQEDRTLLQTAARVYLFDENGTLAEQLARRGRAESGRRVTGPPDPRRPGERRRRRRARSPLFRPAPTRR